MRVRTIVPIAVVVGGLAWIATRGLSGSLSYYVTPTELMRGHVSEVGERVRVGGLVEPGSVRTTRSQIFFVLTDGTTSVPVVAGDDVPALFRGGTGAVVEGVLGSDLVLHGETVMVKHSEVYRPPDGAAAGRT
ncbi:MAG TPA: cytochrome c maturation protein CcmE [Actinomycetota bacterium]